MAATIPAAICAAPQLAPVAALASALSRSWTACPSPRSRDCSSSSNAATMRIAASAHSLSGCPQSFSAISLILRAVFGDCTIGRTGRGASLSREGQIPLSVGIATRPTAAGGGALASSSPKGFLSRPCLGVPRPAGGARACQHLRAPRTPIAPFGRRQAGRVAGPASMLVREPRSFCLSFRQRNLAGADRQQRTAPLFRAVSSARSQTALGRKRSWSGARSYPATPSRRSSAHGCRL